MGLFKGVAPDKSILYALMGGPIPLSVKYVGVCVCVNSMGYLK